MVDRHFVFPKKFLWGAATSSHQVEGDNIHNDWWEWEQDGRIKERSGKACDHWNRFREDFELVKSLHHNAHRFSIEWSRVEPTEGTFSNEALLHYHDAIQSLRANGIEPIVTLHHFTLPLWFAKRGGWIADDAPDLFARYVRKIAGSIGKSVSYWITVNEPVVYVLKSHMLGDWPPGEHSYEKAYRVFSNLLKGHVLAYDAIKDEAQTLGAETPQVGVAQHVAAFAPCVEGSWKDKVSVWLRNLMFNHLFVKALIRGRIFYPGLFRIRLPRMKTLDFIGLNYYTRDFVLNKGIWIPGIYGDVCTLRHHEYAGNRNMLRWEIYPEGLSYLVKDFSRYHLPILIAENGICTNQDEERVLFIRWHLEELARAIEGGAPVIGYLYWSLLDNFEWADGFAPRFGLIDVDFATQKRTIRPSARMFAEICQTGMLNGT